MARTIAEMSIDTRLILERLDRAEIGETVSYEELGRLIGRDVRSCYHLTGTARRRLLRGEKKLFLAVPGVGFKRVGDAEKVAHGGSYIQKSRRACARGARVTTSVDNYDAMSKEDQVRHNAQLSLMLTIRSISSVARLKAVSSQVESASQSLSVAGTLAAIAGSKKTPSAKKVNGKTEINLPIKLG